MCNLDVNAGLICGVARRSFGRSRRAARRGSRCTAENINLAAALAGLNPAPNTVGVALERVCFVLAERHRICSDTAGLDVNPRLISGVEGPGFCATGQFGLDACRTSASDIK